MSVASKHVEHKHAEHKHIEHMHTEQSGHAEFKHRVQRQWPVAAPKYFWVDFSFCSCCVCTGR